MPIKDVGIFSDSKSAVQPAKVFPENGATQSVGGGDRGAVAYSACEKGKGAVVPWSYHFS